MRQMRLLRLRLETRTGWHATELDHRICSVHGPADTGKSSLFDAIGFALGQKTDWRLAMFEFVRRVELTVRIQGQELRLRRAVRKPGHVELLDAGGEVQERVAVQQHRDGRVTISDRLLELLDLSELLAPAEATALGGRSGSYRFDDVWPYLHLAQNEIDRQVILHLDRDSQRHALFEALFNLSDPQIHVLDARLRECERGLRELRAQARTLSEFLTSSDATNADRIHAELEQLKAERASAQGRLQSLRAQGRAATRSADPIRQKLMELGQQRIDAAKLVDGADDRVEERRRNLRLWQRRISEQRRRQFTTCPSCARALQDRPVPDGHCAMCLQELTSSEDSSAQEQARTQHAQAVAALAEAEQEAAAALLALQMLRKQIHATEEELDRFLQHQIGPITAALEQAAAQEAAADARIDVLQRLLEPHGRLRELDESINAAERERQVIRDERDALKDRLSLRRTVLDEIDERFQEVIQALELPWFKGQARLDRRSYLPVVDGQQFAQLGGGTRTAVNIAYSLALLRHALVNRQTHLPGLLLIDSPRKNVGANAKDRALIERLYQHAINTFDTWADTAFAGSRDFQLIIVDNDPPAAARKRVHTIPLNHDKPLIPGVTHADTGEDVDQE
ncbi:hypothetical protein GCM10010149_59270 [Nonomuraea roseoviolacea subsp. roseoviolacea]|uniref:hypothetical protein n=1 Tax=Nonomuraea roseoviolacea TaxID=103837 RepID=UPI0031DEC87D